MCCYFDPFGNGYTIQYNYNTMVILAEPNLLFIPKKKNVTQINKQRYNLIPYCQLIQQSKTMTNEQEMRNSKSDHHQKNLKQFRLRSEWPQVPFTNYNMRSSTTRITTKHVSNTLQIASFHQDIMIPRTIANDATSAPSQVLIHCKYNTWTYQISDSILQLLRRLRDGRFGS